MNNNLQFKSQLDTRELLLLDSEVKSNGKSVLVGYILWYFLGIFGGHRFYMGRTGTAVTQLILSITLVGMIATLIWWVIDAFKLHSWIKEHNQVLESFTLKEIIAHR